MVTSADRAVADSNDFSQSGQQRANLSVTVKSRDGIKIRVDYPLNQARILPEDESGKFIRRKFFVDSLYKTFFPLFVFESVHVRQLDDNIGQRKSV